MKSIIAGLGLFALASAQSNTYVATFVGGNDITGTMTVDNWLRRKVSLLFFLRKMKKRICAAIFHETTMR